MASYATQDPWYLTIIRTQGVLFLRPEKSWRPIVSVALPYTSQAPYEVMLGCDGQNPNLRATHTLNEVDEATRLEITVYHKAHKKSRRKRHVVGTAYVTLGELLKRQERPGADVHIHLRCPPPQKRSPKLLNGRQAHSVTLTVRVNAPVALLPTSDTASSATLVASPMGSDAESDLESEEPSDRAEETDIPWTPEPSNDILAGAVGLRRRKCKRKKPKPYLVNWSDEEDGNHSSVSCATCSSSDEEPSVHIFPCEEDENDMYVSCLASVLPTLPQHIVAEEQQLSLAERAVDRFAPYREMSSPHCDFATVQRRLLSEWYTVAGALLALAGLNAAVFGFSQGTIFQVEGNTIAVRSVIVGSIAAAVGLVIDIWFLMCYSGADADKFERVARDVYGSYFFFCLMCRFPTLCLFVSTCALLVFLLAIAWSEWSTAVLVMCALTGVLLTLQYLVFGVHRLANFVVWVFQRAWRKLRTVFGTGGRHAAAPGPVVAAPHHDLRQTSEEHTLACHSKT